MTRRSALPYALAGATVLLAAAAVALDVLVADVHAGPWIQVALFLVICIPPAVFGVIVLQRQPGNLVGWLLLTHGASLALVFLVDRFALAGLDEPRLPLWEWGLVADQALWPLMFASLVAIAFVFPSGRVLPGRNWRWLKRVGQVSLVAVLFSGLGGKEPFPPPWSEAERPLPEAFAGLIWLAPFGFLGGIVAVGAGVWAVRTRYGRAAGIERQQIRWLASASLLLPAALAVGFFGGSLLGEGERAAGVAALIAGGAIPAAVAVAVTRYRLYELDRLINRTVVYATLTVLLGAAYLGVSLAAGFAAEDGGRLGTAVATLAVAVGFRPLRTRVQCAVDRRFDRARYEVLERLDTFNAEVRDGRAAPEEVGAVLAAALGDPTLEVLFWLPESQLYVDVAGLVRDPAEAGGRQCTPVRRGSLDLGVVLHAETDRPVTLDAALTAAGLTIEIARLRVEVRRQLAEVDASRARIVAAGDAERRRLERDLHDGAQQRLVSIGLALRHTQHGLPESADAVRADLDGAVSELTGAIAELRELSQGIRPAHLDHGLRDALQELARRAPLPVEVDVQAHELPDGVETAAYFVTCEALTNAIKHAGARSVRITAERQERSLRLRIADDGVGGADVTGGSGMVGMADRVAAAGGTLRVDSAAGSGTTVTVELPCAS